MKHTLFICIVLIFIVLGFTSCTTLSQQSYYDVISSSVYIAPQQEMSLYLSSFLQNTRIIFFGETHYVQEHVEFIPTVLQNLQTSHHIVLLQEGQQAFSWIVEDYVLGKRDSFPKELEGVDGFLIRALRECNQRSVAHPIIYRYFDLNHWRGSALISLMLLDENSGGRLSSYIAPLKHIMCDTPEYISFLTELNHSIEEEQEYLKELLGSLTYTRFKEIIACELRSIEFRTSPKDTIREQFLYDRVVSDFIAQESRNEDSPILIINTGMYHAQLTSAMGRNQSWLAQLVLESKDIAITPQDLYSIAFFGLEGERKRTFYQKEIEIVPPLSSRSTRNLVRTINSVWESQVDTKEHTYLFLDLSDPIFSYPVRMSFTFQQMKLVPQDQFHAYFLYPRLSVYASLQEIPL